MYALMVDNVSEAGRELIDCVKGREMIDKEIIAVVDWGYGMGEKMWKEIKEVEKYRRI